MRMKAKGLLAAIVLVTLMMALTACSGSGGSASLSVHEPKGDAVQIINLIAGDQNSLILMDFDGAGDFGEIVVGYDVFAKGKLTEGDVSMGSVPLEKTGDGMIGIWTSHDRIRTAVSTDNGDSVAAMEGDLPWLKDLEKEGVMTQNMTAGQDQEIVKGEKLYFHAFAVSGGDEMSGEGEPAAMAKDPSSMKDLDKVYLFYAVFK